MPRSIELIEMDAKLTELCKKTLETGTEADKASEKIMTLIKKYFLLGGDPGCTDHITMATILSLYLPLTRNLKKASIFSISNRRLKYLNYQKRGYAFKQRLIAETK